MSIGDVTVYGPSRQQERRWGEALPPLLRLGLVSLLLVPLLVPLLALSGCQSGRDGESLPPDADSATSATAELATLEQVLAGTVSPSAGSSDDGRYLQLMQLGLLNNFLGRHRAAEKAFRQALDEQESRYGLDNPAVIDPLIQMAIEVSHLGRYQEADLLFARIDRLGASTQDPLVLARAKTARAIDYANRNDLERAYRLARDASLARRDHLREQAEALRAEGEPVLQGAARTLAETAHGLFVEGLIAFRAYRLDAAEVATQMARKLTVATPNAEDWWVAPMDELLGRIEAARFEADKAEQRLQSAVLIQRREFGERRPVALSLLSLGALYRQGGELTEALDVLRRALAIVREGLDDSEGLGVDRLLPFLDVAWTELDASTDPQQQATLRAEMFQVVQLARQGQTEHSIARTVARLGAQTGGEAAQVLEELQAAMQRRDQHRLSLGREAAKSPAERDLQRFEALRLSYVRAAEKTERLETRLRALLPSYSQLATPRPVDADRLVALLRPDEALVHVVLGRDSGFVFLARQSGITVRPLPVGTRRIDGLVQSLRQAFEVSATGIRPFDMTKAHLLYHLLLEPVAEQMVGVQHLIVVPTGSLLSLPFGLLIQRSPASLPEEAYGAAAWLARDMAMSVAPSIRSFVDLRARLRPSAAPNPFLGFGAPLYRGEAILDSQAGLQALARECRIGEPVRPALLRALSPLPDTADELRRVARSLGAGPESVRLGRAVREEQVRRQRLDRYRVLYFATHGLLPGELQCQSEPALALTPPPGPVQSRDRDGLLDASEVAGLKLDADLVVLSACNTGGSGDRLGGESLSGLARAFFYAGARSLLVSHWQVDSRATTRLMTTLFGALQGGPSGWNRDRRKDQDRKDGGIRLAEGLRQAQKALLQDQATQHPFFWAAFTLVGDGNRGR